MNFTESNCSEQKAASSPVVGTITGNGLDKSRPENLTANLSGVWSALAEIGRQLQILASAQTGQGAFCAQILPLAQPDHSPLTIGQLTREFLLAKARAGKSDRYLRALRNSLLKFSTARNNQPVQNLTVHDFERWLESAQWSARTQKGYLGDVRTMLNFAVRRGYIARNPAAGVELPDCDPAPNSLHTPEQVQSVLNHARAHDLGMMRAMAIRYFTGLRSAELIRLKEENIGDKFVEVTAGNSKTRRRRLVTIQPNLRAWLAIEAKLPGGNWDQRWRNFTRELEAKGIEWPHNVTRHSFCSYHLAHFQNAGKTALQAGHTEQMLFAHYREVVTPEAAAEFWAIVPS